MSDSPNQNDAVAPPTEEDFSPESDRDQMVEDAVQQAQQFHDIMDGAKQWSRETAANLRVEAALEDGQEASVEIEQIAKLVESVTTRIEQGDNNRARQI